MRFTRSLTPANRPILSLALFVLLFGLVLERPVRSEHLQPSFESYADSQDKSQAERVKQILDSGVFSEFETWCGQYLQGKTADVSEQLRRGQYLAIKRRELLRELIVIAPKAALEHAVTSYTYRRLPASITANLEGVVSGSGDFLVYVIDQDHYTRSLIKREVVLGGSRYTAFVYGRRETMTTKFSIPLHGIVVDGSMAVAEEPVRRLAPQELAAQVRPLSIGEVRVEVGGEIVSFSNEAELNNFVCRQVEWEAKIGPVRSAEAVQAESVWTVGLKTVLFIRVDFPDRPGEPVDWANRPLTVALGEDLINNQVNQFYINNSYNKTSLQTTVSPVVRMPQPQSFYVGRFSDLLTDARAAAAAAGYQPNDFNFYVIGMSYEGQFGYGGMAFVGAPGVVINGFFDLRVTAHELGHNYGVLHANLWRTTDGTTIGPGSNVEYGNPFDVMGSGYEPRAHFNVKYKRLLDWLPDENIQTVTTDGVYRLIAYDTPTLSGVRALKIQKTPGKNYWIEFRQLYTDNTSAMNGVLVNWDYQSASQLLDMSPGTPDSLDAPLVIGTSFYDGENLIRMTVLGKANTNPESLDVKIELNVGCTLTLLQTSQSFPANGGEGSIPMDGPSGCRPIAKSNVSWMDVMAVDAAPARYIVSANYNAQPRTGTITVNDQTFTVHQAAATSSCVTQPAGMVAWWRAEGNALDQTGVNHGTLTNNMSFAGGVIGGGFLTNANHRGTVQVPDSTSLALNQSMTFEGWIKAAANIGTIIERRDGASGLAPPYYVGITSGGNLGFFISYDKLTGIGIASTPLPLNEFVHFAVSLDDATGQMKVYVNGVVNNQTTIVQRPYDLAPNASTKVNIGAMIDGIIDELAVYNRALSAAEIQAIYNGGIAADGPAGKCLSDAPATSTIQFSASSYLVAESGSAFITVTRSGDTSAAASVDYSTFDGAGLQSCGQVNGEASERCDYVTSVGTVSFAAGETSKNFFIPGIDDVWVEGNETFSLSLSHAIGGALGTPATANVTIVDNDFVAPTTNPIDGVEFFVRQQYLDILQRQPDSIGWQNWIDTLAPCPNGGFGEPPASDCDRLHVAAGFFQSDEFLDRGYWVFRLYMVSNNQRPTYTQFTHAMAQIGGPKSPAEEEASKAAFVDAFVQRSEFLARYSGLTGQPLANALLQTAGLPTTTFTVTPGMSNAQILRGVAETAAAENRFLTEGMVSIQYFGFLHRDPDTIGYQNNVNTLNANPANLRHMIFIFIYSTEYRGRFGP